MSFEYCSGKFDSSWMRQSVESRSYEVWKLGSVAVVIRDNGRHGYVDLVKLYFVEEEVSKRMRSIRLLINHSTP